MRSLKYGELIAYLGRLDENLYQVDTVIKTGNLMMDAVLGSKLGLMKKRGIRTDVTVQVPKGMKLTDMELCVLVGNLLDNAIEACEEVEEEENRFIRIYMDTLQEQFYLSVMNGMNGRAQRKGTGFVSRKQIDLLMRHIHITAADHRLLFLQFQKIGQKIPFPFHSVFQRRSSLWEFGVYTVTK